jgi:cell division protein YceG involved in septum cleavage
MLLLMAMALAPTAVRAGPCTAEIDQLQSDIDARIDTTAGTGQMAREGTAATMHRQPTPGSIAQAEVKLGEGSSYTQALAALSQARKADQVNDATSCGRSLGAARSALGR